MILLHIHDETSQPPASRSLDPFWDVLAVPLDVSTDVISPDFQHYLIDVDLNDRNKQSSVRKFLQQAKRNGRLIFACSMSDERAVIQACTLGATRIIESPVNDEALLSHLIGVDSDLGRPASAVVGSLAVDVLFKAISGGKHLAVAHLQNAAVTIAGDIGEQGIGNWLHSIREHHVGTYQHCLLVTGVATAFGQEIGLSGPDVEKLTLAALVHDVGKSRIDVDILDKPGALTFSERATIEMHPVWGEKFLREQDDVTDDICDCVRHHHEFLDGSGYPDGLRGPQISDLTRLLTISDIFGALLERRPYKPPIPAAVAYGILSDMGFGGKLETALVRAFRPVASICDVSGNEAHARSAIS